VKNNVLEIAKTINSLHSQKFKNFEHIIIDANSHDGTSQIIKKKINTKIKYYRGPDAGIYDAINKGINYSRGQYVGILHAGDFFSSVNILSEINRCIKKYDIFFANIIFFDKKKNILRYWKKSLINLNLYNAYKIPHTAMFIKRKAFQEVGSYNVDYSISSDTDFILNYVRGQMQVDIKSNTHKKAYIFGHRHHPIAFPLGEGTTYFNLGDWFSPNFKNAYYLVLADEELTFKHSSVF
jgi:glycosyltransferase